MSWLSKTVKKVGKAFTGIPEVITQVGSDVLTNVFNSKAQKEQQAFDLKMWNLQNEYNTPANQVARLRAAGLNPNLFYGQGNVGNATSAPTTDAVRYNFDFAKAFDKMALVEQMKNMREQNKNLQEQNAAIRAGTLKTKSEARILDKYGMPPSMLTGLLEVAEKNGYSFEQAVSNVLKLMNLVGGTFGNAAGAYVGSLGGTTAPRYTKNGERIDSLSIGKYK